MLAEEGIEYDHYPEVEEISSNIGNKHSSKSGGVNSKPQNCGGAYF
jgi:hypothetical protein